MDWWDGLREAAWLFGCFLALLGAIAGSFASAAIYRLPREGLSLVSPARSFCPACNRRLRWFDNLPILSYILLRGRCRYCGVSYGPGYLLNELGLAGVFVLAGQGWAADSGPLALGVLLVALTGLWIAAVVDWQHMILPDQITLGGVPAGFVAALLAPGFHLWQADRSPWGTEWFGLDAGSPPILLALASAGLGASAGFVLLFGIRKLFSYLLGQEALGFGDVKYLAAVGAWVGLEGATWTLLVGVVAGSVLGIANVLRMILVVLRRRRHRGRRSPLAGSIHLGWLLGRQIPFGPPLVLGTGLVLLAPQDTHHFFLDTWPALIQSWIA